MEPENSLPHWQVPATCPYSEPTQSSPHNPLPLPEDPSSSCTTRSIYTTVDLTYYAATPLHSQ
jgi:hypothetical protein